MNDQLLAELKRDISNLDLSIWLAKARNSNYVDQLLKHSLDTLETLKKCQKAIGEIKPE